MKGERREGETVRREGGVGETVRRGEEWERQSEKRGRDREERESAE